MWGPLHPDERIESVVGLWSYGAAYNEIADKCGISRGAVAGIINRHTPPKPGTRTKVHGSYISEAREVVVKPRKPSVAKAPAVALKLVSPARPTPPVIGPASACAFPLWGHLQRPNNRFCAAPSVPGRSWCETHCAVVFAPQRVAA